jgi:hypothetical protein
MNDRDRENLAELIERLYHDEQAEGVLQDIRQGEQILHENPAPEPDRQFIADIKAQIALLIPTRQAQIARWRKYKRAAVAAAIIIISVISATFFNGSPPEYERAYSATIFPTNLWDSKNIEADDENLAVFNAQIDQIENEIMILESGDDTGDSAKSIEEMEIELIVVSNDFWKE